MEPVDEQRSLRLPDSTTLPADRVQFAEEVAVIHPGAIPVTRGRPKVSVRKLSLSFGPKPTATDVEDPSFTPTPQRTISFRLPSISRALSPPRTPSAVSPSSSGEPLRSCLAEKSSPSSSSNGAGPSPRPRARSRASLPNPPPPSLATAFAPSSLPASSSLPSASHPIRPPTARARSSSTSISSAAFSSASDSEWEPATLPLRACCRRCLKATDLGLAEGYEVFWSFGAQRKRERDAEEKEREERALGTGAYAPGSSPTPNQSSSVSGRDGEEGEEDDVQVEGIGRKAVVDEVDIKARKLARITSDGSLCTLKERTAAGTSGTSTPRLIISTHPFDGPPTPSTPVQRSPFQSRRSTPASSPSALSVDVDPLAEAAAAAAAVQVKLDAERTLTTSPSETSSDREDGSSEDEETRQELSGRTRAESPSSPAPPVHSAEALKELSAALTSSLSPPTAFASTSSISSSNRTALARPSSPPAPARTTSSFAHSSSSAAVATKPTQPPARRYRLPSHSSARSNTSSATSSPATSPVFPGMDDARKARKAWASALGMLKGVAVAGTGSGHGRI